MPDVLITPNLGTLYVPLEDEGKGGADFSLVTIERRCFKPACRLHGAMNKVSESPPGIWRCITTAGPKVNGCRAACREAEGT